MTEFATFTGKNVDEAVNNALLQLQITSEKLEYEVVEKGSNGLLGFIGSKPAVILSLIHILSGNDKSVRLLVQSHQQMLP